MDRNFPTTGLYDLSPEDIYVEAIRLYEDFFYEQTPLKVFRLSITLHHLREWVVPTRAKAVEAPANVFGDEAWRAELVSKLDEYPYYEVLRSLADNSKHHTLSRSSSYEKRGAAWLQSRA